MKVIKYFLQIFVIWNNGAEKKWIARYTFWYIVLLTLCNGDRRIVHWSHCTTAIADTYSSNTKTRCPWEAEVLEGPSQYCRHPGYPALLPIIGIHRGGQKLILPHSQLSPLDTFVQESLFPLEVTEQPLEVEVTTTSSSVLAGENEGEEGTNFDEMSRIIQVSSYFHLPDRSSSFFLGK